MAISFVGSHVGTHAATSAQTIAFSNLRNEANAQPTLLEGDIVLVAVEVSTANVDRTQAQLTPSGYTAAHTDRYENDSNDSNFLVSYKVMGATPDTSVAIPASNATTAGVAYAIYVFRGVNTTTPFDATPVATGAINTGVANAPAITPVTPGAWVVVFGGAAVAAGAVFTNPAGMSATTNHFRTATITTTTTDANIAGAIFTGWTSGPYDPAAFGGSTTTNTGSWSATTIALKPFVTHNTTGTLTGPGSTVVGSAALVPASVEHGTSGVLTGPGASITGAAVKVVIHGATGALTGQGSTLAGSSSRTRQHATSGLLSGSGAVVVASATRFRLHGSSGTLQGPGAVIAGTAARTGLVVNHGTSGALTGQRGPITGTAARTRQHNGTGGLTGQGSSLSGSAQWVERVPVLHDTDGALLAPGATITARVVLQPVVRVFKPVRSKTTERSTSASATRTATRTRARSTRTIRGRR